MHEGFVLIFNRKESEKGYPYINVYNLIEVEIDKEEWDEDPYIVLSKSHKEISIGSWEENNDYQEKIAAKIEKMDLKGKYICKDRNEMFMIYDADNKTYLPMLDCQEKIEHNFAELLCSLYVLFP